MPSHELLFVSLLVLSLVGLAGYYGWQQVQTLRRLKGSQEPLEDRFYARNQAVRRLAGCVLMTAGACLLAGWFLLGLQDVLGELLEQGHAVAQAQAEQPPQMTPEQRRMLHVCSLYLILTLVVFFFLICTAALDVVAIRRYSRRHLEKIQADRRAMVARQAARLRSQRNGHN